MWLTTALWAVLDSEARGRNPFVWGLLTFFFGPFALGAYAISGGREGQLTPRARSRTYFFTASFFFLGVVYASLVALLGVALDAGVSQDPLDSDEARIATSILLAVLVFALPLWAFHWVRAQDHLHQPAPEADERAVFLLTRRYGAVVIIIASLVTLGFGIFLAFSMFASIFGVFEGGGDTFLPVVAFLPITGLLIAYHYLAIFVSPRYRDLASRYGDRRPHEPAATLAPLAVEAPAPEPEAPPQAARLFCGQCGAENTPASRFCTACGTPLERR